MGQANLVVIGNFDGVHRGHQAVLQAARGSLPGARVIVVTFWPHPMSVVRPGKQPLLLTDLGDRINLLKDAGADEVVVIPFDRELAALSPEDFVERFIRPLDPVRIVVGENFRFGHRAKGNSDTLRALGFEVTALDLVESDHATTCSTEIRRLVAEGDMAGAWHHLGRPYRFRGTVVYGHQRGRELGFPTANLPVPEGVAAPADGVYAGWLHRLDRADAEFWPAAISVGRNPTFDDVPEVVVEAHVLGRDDLNLYGVPVSIDFAARLRGNVRFDGLDALIAQIAQDCADVSLLLSDLEPPTH
nr:bifunctional riboflavin kinase/FAD synthetase [Granulicoccus phenolivorans]